MTKNITRILIVSDLHADTDDSQNRKDSKLIFQDEKCDFADGVIDKLSTLDEKIDILICSGDISNKASYNGLNLGWQFLHRIQSKLSIPNLLCVPGNHDHNSRKTDPKIFDPKHTLQFITPPFPFPSHRDNTQFWAWHWCHSVTEEHNINVISLNSSAYHGYDDEHDHGRVAIEVADQIKQHVESSKFNKRDFNILLCHHHPEIMEHVDSDFDLQVMDGGQYLLKLVNEADKGPWLIIHGHKHFADISYGKSSHSSSPVIFSAGSLSACLYPALQDLTSNQFYILEIDHEKTKRSEKITGTFQTFSWTYGSGWHPSTSENLPANGGFGNSTPIGQVVDKVTHLINDENPHLNQSDIDNQLTELQFFTPNEISMFIGRVEKKGLVVTAQHNKVIEIGRKHE